MTPEVIQKIRALDNDPALEGLNPTERIDAIADRVELSDKERMEMKQTAISSIAAWTEVRDNITCECGEKAHWLFMKAAHVTDGLGYDVFPFRCTVCEKITEREWRAPSLDGKKIKPYVTRYKKGS